MNQQNHNSSLMSVTMMMSATGSHMSSANSLSKALLLSDMDLADHLDTLQNDNTATEAGVPPPPLLLESVSSSLFAQMVEEMEQNKNSKGNSNCEKRQDDFHSAESSLTKSSSSSHHHQQQEDEQPSASLQAALAIQSFEDLPEHEFDNDLLAVMNSFQKHMSVSSHVGDDDEHDLLQESSIHSHEEEEDKVVRLFQIGHDDCSPRPLSNDDQKIIKGVNMEKSKKKSKRSSAKKRPKKVNDMVPFPIPTFKKDKKKEEEEKGSKNNNNQDDDLNSPIPLKPRHNNNSATMCSPTLALTDSVEHIAPALVTPNSGESFHPSNSNSSETRKPEVEIINLDQVVANDTPPVPAFEEDEGEHEAVHQHHYGDHHLYPAVPQLTVTTASSRTEGQLQQGPSQWHDSLSSRESEDNNWGRAVPAPLSVQQQHASVHSGFHNSNISVPYYPPAVQHQQDYYDYHHSLQNYHYHPSEYHQHQQPHHYHNHHHHQQAMPQLPVLTNDRRSLETEYQLAAERLQHSMLRSKMSRSVVTRGPASPDTSVTCASANSGALLRQQHPTHAQQHEHQHPAAGAAYHSHSERPVGGFFSHV